MPQRDNTVLNNLEGMSSPDRYRQSGLSLIGFIFVLMLVLFFVYIGIKLVPIYINHMSVVSDLKAVAEEPGSANLPASTIRRNLAKRFQISFVDHIEARDVTVERSNPPRLVAEYNVEEHLIGNIDVIVRFRRVETLQN
jgi:hypothetical protein